MFKAMFKVFWDLLKASERPYFLYEGLIFLIKQWRLVVLFLFFRRFFNFPFFLCFPVFPFKGGQGGSKGRQEGSEGPETVEIARGGPLALLRPPGPSRPSLAIKRPQNTSK